MRLSHLTILTRDLEAARSAWQKASVLAGPIEESDDRAVAALPVADVEIELVQPKPGSAIEALLEERGEGMFSLTIEVDDLGAALSDLRAKGVGVSVLEVGQAGEREAVIEPLSSHGVPISLREKQR
jgi:methylmalonyl-CoA/ethylmalonyl-CoA epimerase